MIQPTKEQELIVRCIEMAVRNGVCPDSSVEDIARSVLFSHEKGYLITNRLGNAFVSCYRIPEITEKNMMEIPEEEKGEILFVNFAVSENHNPMTLLKILRDYMKENPDVKELVYYRRGNHEDFKRIHLRR